MLRRHFIKFSSLLGLAPTVPLFSAPQQSTAADLSASENGSDDRSVWSEWLFKIAEPVLKNLAEGNLRKNWTVEYSPIWDKRPAQVAYLEAFGRTMVGIAPWLALPDDATDESRKRQILRGLALKAVAQSVDPQSPDYMLWRQDNQPLVDAAFLAQAFLKAPEALWKPLENTTKQRVIAEFRQMRRVVAVRNNWVLFTAMIEAFLLSIGEDADNFRIETALLKIEKWYVGDGWYSDGDVFHMDYYNSFVIQPMLVDVLQAQLAAAQRQSPQGNHQAMQDRYNQAVKRLQRHAEFLERMISPEGSFPPFGRSITYRTAVFQALGHTALLEKLPEGTSPAQVRAGMTAAMRRLFAQSDVFDAHGWLTLGFAGHQPNIADSYSNSGSMYLATVGFLPLGLAADNAFWTSPAEDWTQRKAWSGKPFKKDYAVNF